MSRDPNVSRMMSGAGLVVLGLAVTEPAWSIDSSESTGAGFIQGEDASMSTKRGGNTGPTTGRNERSGSATGAVRDPSEAEPPRDEHRGSSQNGFGIEPRSKSDRKRR
jgi:hypothetical protein